MHEEHLFSNPSIWPTQKLIYGSLKITEWQHKNLFTAIQNWIFSQPNIYLCLLKKIIYGHPKIDFYLLQNWSMAT
jgi:hypothetical protein